MILFLQTLNILATFIVSCVLLFLLLTIFDERPVSWRDAVVGVALSAVVIAGVWW